MSKDRCDLQTPQKVFRQEPDAEAGEAEAADMCHPKWQQ